MRLAIAASGLVLASLFGSLLEQRDSSPARHDEFEPRKPWVASKIKGTAEPPAPYRIEPAFPNLVFTRPTSLSEIPGTNRLLVTQHNGMILSFEKDQDVSEADQVFDVKSVFREEFPKAWTPTFHLTYHPDFESNGFVYICYVHPADGRHSRVSRFQMTLDPLPKIEAASEKVILKWLAGGHNGGCLQFGQDGYLYISTGDGSAPNPPDGLTTGQTVDDLLGAILRLDVDVDDKDVEGVAYRIPADNPFVGIEGARPEIWSFGLRNPWKFAIDTPTGDLLIADNGWESWEMVHRAKRGTNSGWPIMEGRVALRSDVERGPTPITPPIKDHSHAESNSVIGGPIYRGSELGDLDGAFVYGDYVTGTIWAIDVDDESHAHRTLVETDLRVIAFEAGSNGELWVVDYDYTGQIYRLVPSETIDLSASFPRLLSETGLFQSIRPLIPADGVVPYEVNSDRWLDGLTAKRWVAIPGEETINLATDIPQARYPNGTVLVKHISCDSDAGPRPIETQLLHFENGVWNPYAYLWDDEAGDARLVDSSGETRQLSAAEFNVESDRTWRVTARSECRLCHNPGAKVVLGFVPGQLDKRDGDGRPESSQLVRLAKQEVLAGDLQQGGFPESRLCDPFAPGHSVADRARSYLHANCSMCHHPDGNAIVSFYLRADQPFNELRTNKGSGAGEFGIKHAKIITPGHPSRSLLFYRMAKMGSGRMPAFGSHVVDGRAVALMEEWIRSMPEDPSSPELSVGGGETELAAGLHHLIENDGEQTEIREHIEALLETTEGALELVSMLHSSELDMASRQVCIDLGAQSASPEIRGLIEAFVPEESRRRTLGPRPDPATILALVGDAERGELIYMSDGARCRKCHDSRDVKKSLGPTIEQIVKKFPGRVELLRQILEPARRIDDKFATYTVVTDDGRVISGLKMQDNEKLVRLKTAEQELVTIQREQIEEIVRGDQSLMPEQLMSDLTAQEAADLLAYLRTH